MALSAVLSKEMTVSLGGNTIGYTTDFDFEINKETIDITTLTSSGWKDYMMDLKEWKVSFSGLMTRGVPGANQWGSEDVLDSLIDTDTALAVLVKTTVSGDQYISGSAFLTSYKQSGSVGDKITFSGELQGTGALTNPSV